MLHYKKLQTFHHAIYFSLPSQCHMKAFMVKR